MFWSSAILAIEPFFRVYIASTKHEEGWDSETVMQTRDVVEGLDNFRDFS